MADAGLDDLLVAYPLVGEPKLRPAPATCWSGPGSGGQALTPGRGGRGARPRRPRPRRGRRGEVLGRGRHRAAPARPARPARPPPSWSASFSPGSPAVQGGRGCSPTPAIRLPGTPPRSELAPARRGREVLDLVETAALCRRRGVGAGREISVGSTPTARVGAFVDGVTEVRPRHLRPQRRHHAAARCRHRSLHRGHRAGHRRRPPDRRAGSWSTRAASASPPTTWAPSRTGCSSPAAPTSTWTSSARSTASATAPGDGDLRVGERLRVIPSHACACVNMFDVAYGVRGGRVERELPIAGRGKVR